MGILVPIAHGIKLCTQTNNASYAAILHCIVKPAIQFQ